MADRFTLEVISHRGARRRFKTRIGLLAQPNFPRPITRAKVHSDTSISVSAAYRLIDTPSRTGLLVCRKPVC